MSDLVVNPLVFSCTGSFLLKLNHYSKLRHANILTLMGVCQSNNLDGLMLIFERIGYGSLFNYLHQKVTPVWIVFIMFLARLHEVHRAIAVTPVVHVPVPVCVPVPVPVRVTLALKFSRSPYLDNHSSESIHTWTIDTL